MKLLKSLIIGCLITNSAFAQDFNSNSYYNDVIPPSPTVASINKFIENPVNYYTGVPQISIPIWQVKSHDLTHNISIDYHAGGIKVQEIASWVGLGWSLKAGGTVSRSVKSRADDIPSRGYLTSGYDYDNLSVGNTDFCWDVTKEKYDSEPDIFFFSAGNISGKFVIDCQNGINITKDNIHQVPWQNVIINPVMGQNNQGNQSILGFEIIDQDGLVYTFGSTEESRETSHTYTNSDGLSSGTDIYYSAWQLNKIESRKTGATIDFGYKHVTEYYDISRSYTVSDEIKIIEEDNGFIANGGQYPSHFKSWSITVQQVITSKLTHISFNQGSVVFNSTDYSRHDLRRLGDTKTGNILNSIIIKTAKDTLVREFELSHSYFNDDASEDEFLLKRLKLNSIEEIGENEESQKYEFSYFSQALPSRDSYSVDFWGYYNGMSNGGTFGVPAMGYLDKMYNGADKNPYIAYGKAGTLESIKFPTGGITRFDYEQNTYRYVQNTPLGLEQTEHQFNLSISHPVGDEPQSITSESEQLNINKFQWIDFNFLKDNDSFSAIISNNAGGTPITLYYPERIRLEPGDYTVTLNAYFVCGECSGTLAGTSSNISFNYYEELSDSIKSRKCGGLRIRTIRNFNPGELTPVKTQLFGYTESIQESFSSGDLVSVEPIYHYTTKSKYIAGSFNPPSIIVKYLVRSSNFINSFNLTQGSSVAYKEVSVRNISSDLRNNGSTNYYYSTGTSVGETHYPAASKISDDWKFGNLNRKLLKNNLENPLLEEVNNHNIVNISADRIASGFKIVFDLYDPLDPNNTNHMHTYLNDTYRYNSGYVYLDSKKTTLYYQGSSPIITTETFEYDTQSKYLLKKYTKEDAHEKLVTQFKYPFSYFPNNLVANPEDEIYPLWQMNYKHMDNYPVEVIKEKTINGNTTITDANLIQYKDYNPDKIYNLNNGVSKLDFIESNNSNGTFTFDDNYYLKASIKRDSFANPVEILTNKGVPTSYIWAYNNSLLVAKIENMDYDTLVGILDEGVLTDIGEYNDSSDINQKIRIIRNHPNARNTLITSFSYKPMVGLIQQTDPNNVSTNYKYDRLGRLITIKDNNDYILKHYRYSLQSEQTAPNPEIGEITNNSVNLNWVAISGTESYYIYKSTDNVTYTKISETSSINYTDNTVNPNTNYFYKLKTIKDGIVSIFSNVIAVETKLDPPGTPVITGITSSSPSQVSLIWTNISGETGYRIYRGTSSGNVTTLITDLGANITSFTNSALGSGTIYYYKIEAYNKDYPSTSTVVNTYTRPGTPGAVSGTTLICPYSTNTYSVAAVTGATSYTWIVPSGWSIVSGQGTRTVSISASGTGGSIQVRANNSSGSGLYQSKTINIESPPATPGVICCATVVSPNITYTYTISAVSGAESYTWYVPKMATIVSGQGTTTLRVIFPTLMRASTISVKSNNCAGSSLASSINVNLTDRLPFEGN